MNITSTLRYIGKSIDILILGKFVSLEAVGTYSLAKRIGNLFAYFTDPLSVVIYPEFTKAWSKNKTEEVITTFKKVTTASTVFIIAAYVTAGVASLWLIPEFFGQDYSKAILIIWLFLPGTVFTVGFFSLYYLLLTFENSRAILWGTLMQLVSLVILMPLFTIFWNEVGAAGAVSVSIILSNIYYLKVVRGKFRQMRLVPAL